MAGRDSWQRRSARAPVSASMSRDRLHEPREPRDDVLGMQRLGEVVAHPKPQDGANRVFVLDRRQDHHGQLLEPLALANGRERFDPIHRRHEQVEQDEAELLPLELFERFASIGRFDYGQSEFPRDNPRKQQPRSRLIVDDQHLH
jgi:hypothetical protein